MEKPTKSEEVWAPRSRRAAKLEHESKRNSFFQIYGQWDWLNVKQGNKKINSLLFSRLLKCYLAGLMERPLVEAGSCNKNFLNKFLEKTSRENFQRKTLRKTRRKNSWKELRRSFRKNFHEKLSLLNSPERAARTRIQPAVGLVLSSLLTGDEE